MYDLSVHTIYAIRLARISVKNSTQNSTVNSVVQRNERTILEANFTNESDTKDGARTGVKISVFILSYNLKVPVQTSGNI